MTRQDLFDRICTHLMTQASKSGEHKSDRLSKEYFECQYKGPDGCACAIGCLLSDAHYKAEFEGKLVEEKDVMLALRRSIGPIGPTSVPMLLKLQSVHDYKDVEDWPQELRAVGKEYKLKTKVVDDLEQEFRSKIVGHYYEWRK